MAHGLQHPLVRVVIGHSLGEGSVAFSRMEGMEGKVQYDPFHCGKYLSRMSAE